MERPRKRGAKFTNKDIAADEIIQDVASGYDAKRDRWNGYDPSEHKKVYEEYQAIEAARQKLREEAIDKQTTTDLAEVRKVAKAGKAEGGKDKDDDFGSSEDEDEDADKYAEAADAVGQKLDTKTRITVRNLRIREDTAKYLINLDPSSAYYDPKTRSMRDNPLQNVPPEEVRITLCCSTPIYWLILTYRRGSREKTSSDTLVRLLTSKSCNCLRGMLLRGAMMCICTPTPLKGSFFTRSIKRRKLSSKTQPKSVY